MNRDLTTILDTIDTCSILLEREVKTADTVTLMAITEALDALTKVYTLLVNREDEP